MFKVFLIFEILNKDFIEKNVEHFVKQKCSH